MRAFLAPGRPAPSILPAMGKEALRLSTVLAASPQVVYRAWFEPSQHAAFTKHAAKLDDHIGGKFSLRDGKITGRNMALEFGRRLVQSWRSTEFPKVAPDSRLEVVFESVGAGTRMTVMHSDLPQGFAEPLRAFWLESYCAPMTDYFGKFATILANTPPSQAVLPADEEHAPAEAARAPEAKASKLSGKSKARAKARAAREAREAREAAELDLRDRASKPRASAKSAAPSAKASGRAVPSYRRAKKKPDAGRPGKAAEAPPKKATLRFPKEAPAARTAKTSKPDKAEKKPAAKAKAKPSKPVAKAKPTPKAKAKTKAKKKS